MLLWQLPQKHKDSIRHPALRYREEEISYQEAADLIEGYARLFQDKGLEPGERVAIISFNCPDFILSYLGCLRAGGIAVPLNFMLTLPEIAYILKDAGCSFIVIHEQLYKKLNLDPSSPLLSGLKGVVLLGEESRARARSLPPARPVEAREEDICAFLYTSGTTGLPKGAMLSHKNFLANVKALHEVSQFGPDNDFLSVLPMFHSFAWTTSVLLPIYLGSTITIKESFQPKEILDILTYRGITVFCGVPAMFTVLVRLGDLREFKALKFAISGGAPLDPRVGQAFEEKFRVPLVEGYGLTEASPVVCLNPLYGKRKPGSVGFPLPGIEVRIVDEKGQEVPLGEVGELIVKGPNVMAGYYNRPEETAETLRDGWLYTGDLARKDEEGYIYIVDRKKDLIITGGFNVYPREVEEALMAHPAVAEAAVIGVGDPLRGEEIKAYIILRSSQQVSCQELREFLRGRLAPYKIPRYFAFVEDLPRSTTGKVLKRVLKEQGGR